LHRLFKYLKLIYYKPKTKSATQENGGGKAKPVVHKACFLSRSKEILMVNLAPKQINLAPRQTVLLCSASPSSLTVHTIPEFSM